MPSFLHFLQTPLDWTVCPHALWAVDGIDHINSPLRKWTDVRADGKHTRQDNMASSVWGLLCVILASGTLGAVPPFGSQNRKIQPTSPLIPRGSSQVRPRFYQRVGDVRSTEPTSGAETVPELGGYAPRGVQRRQRGTNNHLPQDRAGGAGWFVGRDLCAIHSQYLPTCCSGTIP